MREVEPEMFRRYERAPLLDVRAEHAAKRRMQQVRRRVIERGQTTPLAFDARSDGRADPQLAFAQYPSMQMLATAQRRVIDGEFGVAGRERTGVSDLSARLRVDRRAIEHDHGVLARR